MENPNLLESIPVPWNISPSASGLRLVADEYMKVIVEVNVYFPSAAECEAAGASPQAYVSGPDGKYRWIWDSHARLELCFDKTLFSSIYSTPAEFLECTDLFDFTKLPRRSESHKEWKESGISIDTWFYQVKNSELLQRLGSNDPKQIHYLIQGKESHLEVVAESWSWRPQKKAADHSIHSSSSKR